MVPLVVLIVSFGVFYFINKKLLSERWSLSYIGRLSMALMLIYTGLGHFVKTDVLVEMLPDFFLFKVEIIYLTGLVEWLSAIGLLVNRIRVWVSWLLIIFLVGVLPANIIGSLEKVQLGGMEYGAEYLYFRVPLQFFFIAWVFYFGIKLNPSHESHQITNKF